MEIFDSMNAFKLLCKSTKKWGMYISINSPSEKTNYYEEAIKAAPYLNLNDHFSIIFDGNAILLFDSREEMENYFWQTVGDDGPTHLNKYDGTIRIYALTCSNEGKFLNENT